MTERPVFATNAVNLASPRLGSEAVRASDEFFAPKERMLQDSDPIFIADKYDDHGKWMDGWESRRRRDGGEDWCLIRLGVPGIVSGVDIDTSHFTGNYAPAASIEACLCETEPDPSDPAWTQIVAPSDLGPDAHHYVAVAHDRAVNWLRLHIHPDGGVARLRVFGRAYRDWSNADRSQIHELSALTNGGRVVAYNNAHFGDVWALLSAGRGLNMGDGWETRRRREPGSDWLIAELGAPGLIEAIEVDTAHFKGNYPESCSLQAAHVAGSTDKALITQSMFWNELLGRSTLQADLIHRFDGEAIRDLGPVTHVRLNIFPDGGVSRLRIFGKLTGGT